MKNNLSSIQNNINFICITASMTFLLALNGTGWAKYRGTPYLSYPAAIPGTIQAVDFDEGGENISYYNPTPGNVCGTYRDTDISTCTCLDDSSGTPVSCGYRVGYVYAGEWLKYTVNVQASSTYSFAVQATTTETGNSFSILVDGVSVTGPMFIPAASSWYVWSTVQSPPVFMSAGTHRVTLYFNTGDTDVNYLTVSDTTATPSPTATDTPSPSPTATDTPNPSPTATDTLNPSPTATDTPSPSPTPTAVPTPAPTPIAGAVNDEFVGPLASWLDVKTEFGAAGDGVSDDTTAIQNAFNYIQAHGGTVYFPAGTYPISSTLTYASTTTAIRMIGSDPATTTIQWTGTAGGNMISAPNGFKRSEIGRLSFNGNNTANAVITVGSGDGNGGHDNMYFDNVFANATYGYDDVGGAGNDTSMFLRNHFNNLQTAIYANNYNALELWMWYSTFTNNGIGINVVHGGFSAWYNVFTGSSVADIEYSDVQQATMRGNVSSGSNRFYYCGAGWNTNVTHATFQDNRILNTTQPDAIRNCLLGGNILLDNQILSKPGNTTTPVVDPQTSLAGNSAFALGNSFTVNSPYINLGGSSPRLVEIGDQTVTASSISTSLPTYLTPSNFNRSVTEITSGTAGSTIQSAINSVCPNGYQGGNRPVIHLQAGSYGLGSTLVFPANCDVQLIGDGFIGDGQTQINWTGSSGGKMIQLHSPSKVLISEIHLNGGGNTEGMYIGSEDVSGSRVQISQAYDNFNVSRSIYAANLANTLVNLYGWWGDKPINGVPVNYLIQVVGNGNAAAASRVAGWGNEFGGSSGPDSQPAFGVSNQGHLIMEDHYGEDNNSPYQLFNLTDSGTITEIGGQWQPDVKSENPEFTVNGFDGTLTIANTRLTSGAAGTSYGSWAISSISNSNILLADNHIDDPNFDLGLTFGPTVSLIQTFQQVAGVFSPVADNNNMNSTQMAAQFAQLRNNSPSQSTTLPTGVSDVQILRMQLDAVTTGFDIEPGA